MTRITRMTRMTRIPRMAQAGLASAAAAAWAAAHLNALRPAAAATATAADSDHRFVKAVEGAGDPSELHLTITRFFYINIVNLTIALVCNSDAVG